MLITKQKSLQWAQWSKAVLLNDAKARQWCDDNGIVLQLNEIGEANGGIQVSNEQATFHRAFAEEVKRCFAGLADDQKAMIRRGQVCALCKDTCRICYSARGVYEAILLDGVWQDCCKAVGIADCTLA